MGQLLKTSFQEVYANIEIENEDDDNYENEVATGIKDSVPPTQVADESSDELVEEVSSPNTLQAPLSNSDSIENAQQNVEQSNQVSSSQSNSLQIMSTPPQQLVNREDNTSQAPISLDTDIPSLDIEPVSSN